MKRLESMATGDTVTAKIDCREPKPGRTRVFRGSAGRVVFFHRDEDPEGVNRIHASVPGLTVEVLPSKGFSVGQTWKDDRPVFWKPPIGLCDPGRLDLHSPEVAVAGEPSPGFSFLKTFSGGIELYGLRNWGMPFRDPENGGLHPLHGETSNIPVEHCEVSIGRDKVAMTGVFIYRDMPLSSSSGGSDGSPEGGGQVPGGKPQDAGGGQAGDPDSQPWYRQGKELFRVERQVVLEWQGPRLRINDTITHVGTGERVPDWGYHITFHPGSGSRILVPSRSVANRSGQPVPADFEQWSPAPDPAVREEQGMIHKGLQILDADSDDRTSLEPARKSVQTGDTDQEMSRALILREDTPAVRVTFPAAPYFQTWLCRGGAFSREFTWASDGEPLFRKPWDGIGIEIGSSALDHDGNTDPDVPAEKTLQPGTSRVISLHIDFPENEELERDILEIQRYNTDRSLKK